jgi:opacity protein-like surface antigen
MKRTALSFAALLFSHVAHAQLTPPAPLGPTTSPPGSDGDPMATRPASPPNGQPASGPGGATSEPNPGVNPPPSPMAAQLNQAESEDNGRGFELVWLRGEAAFSHIKLSSFSSDTLSLKTDSSSGAMFGAGVGLRFLLLTLGVRARMHQLSAFSLWQVNGVLGAAIPISSLDLSFTAHGGYSFVGRLSNDAAVGTVSGDAPALGNQVSITGFNAGAGVALDYYVTPLVSIGAGVTGEALFLKRPLATIPADVPADVRAQIESSELYKNSGTSVGFGIAAGARIGLHFGI